MYKTVEMPGRLFNLFTHLVVAIKIENIRNQIKCILVILNFGVQASEIETIGEVIFIDFAKVLVAA